LTLNATPKAKAQTLIVHLNTLASGVRTYRTWKLG